MRRRLRRQRRVREALLLDLGALVYELHRQGKRAPELLQKKAGELTIVDEEVRGLEEALGDGAGLEGLIATGIVGSCVVCGALLNAGDGFCARCGAPAQVRAADTGEWRADADTGEFEAGEAEAGDEGAAGVEQGEGGEEQAEAAGEQGDGGAGPSEADEARPSEADEARPSEADEARPSEADPSEADEARPTEADLDDADAVARREGPLGDEGPRA